jgi:DNA-binding MarR family transcriptional regulator
MAQTPESEAYTDLILAIFRFWSSLSRHRRAITEPFGQTPARWQVLGGIRERPRTVPQIARQLGFARQSVQQVANALYVEGLAMFIPNPDHRRSPLVGLTDQGHDVLEDIDAAQIALSNQIAAGLNLQDLEISARVIRQITIALDSIGA